MPVRRLPFAIVALGSVLAACGSEESTGSDAGNTMTTGTTTTRTTTHRTTPASTTSTTTTTTATETAISTGTATTSTTDTATATTTGSSPTSTTTTTTTTTASTSVAMCEGPNSCFAPVCPPMLEGLKPAPSGPGLLLSWIEPQPCDTVEVEWEYGLIGYPSQQTPPGMPQFIVPGTMMSVTNTLAVQSNMYTFHAKCVVGGVESCWSNELANNGHPADAGM